MLKIGVIGLGDIAQKAYLPVLGSKALELHLFTRDKAKLNLISAQYRIGNMHESLDSLISAGIKGAFVHTATTAHEEIIEHLLLNNIHVYVDKPITYHYSSAKRLTDLAESRGLILMCGFNRRYAPAYQKLKEISEPNMIIMQKNRLALPGEVRNFVFDDFIHVIDTVRFLFPYEIKDIIVNGRKKNGLLYHAVVQFIAANGNTAFCIMNRDSGTVEEKLEIFSAEGKTVVYDVSDTVVYRNKNAEKTGSNDWDPMLLKRGFENIIAYFLRAVETGEAPGISMQDALASHEVCERVVVALEKI